MTIFQLFEKLSPILARLDLMLVPARDAEQADIDAVLGLLSDQPQTVGQLCRALPGVPRVVVLDALEVLDVLGVAVQRGRGWARPKPPPTPTVLPKGRR